MLSIELKLSGVSYTCWVILLYVASTNFCFALIDVRTLSFSSLLSHSRP